MRILFLSTQDLYCGVASYTKNLASSLEVLGHDVTIHTIPAKIDFQYSTRREIRHFFRDFVELSKEYDVVHIQHEYGLYDGCKGVLFSLRTFGRIMSWLRRRKKAVCVTFHSEPIVFAPITRFSDIRFFGVVANTLGRLLFFLHWKVYFSRFFSRFSSIRALVHTRQSLWRFQESGFHKNTLRLIRHGVVYDDTRIFSHDSERLMGKGNNQEKIILSIFGFISEYKGYLRALDVLYDLPENYHLHIIWGKPKDDMWDMLWRLLKKVHKLKLQDRVVISGYISQEEIKDYLAQSDVCFAPYNAWDLSSSGALTWALTSWKPIVASNIHAFREINFDTECLLLAHPESEHEFAWAIQRLVADGDMQRRLCENAQKYSKRYSWWNIAHEHDELYTSVLSR